MTPASPCSLKGPSVACTVDATPSGSLRRPRRWWSSTRAAATARARDATARATQGTLPEIHRNVRVGGGAKAKREATKAPAPAAAAGDAEGDADMGGNGGLGKLSD